MMGLDVPRACLTLAILFSTGCATSAEVWAATAKVSLATASAPAVRKVDNPSSSFVPKDFDVPVLVETETFKIVPLGPDLVKVDFDAYMSSVEHLQKTFTRSSDWPHEGISDADAMRDMKTEQARFENRESFAYAVLTPDGRRERGSVYVRPSTVEGYDAVVTMWVTKDEYDAGFDAELHEWVASWIRRDWPFVRVAYPGRMIRWDDWDALVASNKAKKSKPEGQQR